jgi:hypothetical protein
MPIITLVQAPQVFSLLTLFSRLPYARLFSLELIPHTHIHSLWLTHASFIATIAMCVGVALVSYYRKQH